MSRIKELHRLIFRPEEAGREATVEEMAEFLAAREAEAAARVARVQAERETERAKARQQANLRGVSRIAAALAG
ncbi:MAG TPA: hypothetical protein VED40_23185 [Azospirillaceae bacterium]|nr:hypothetical protein [Azospirillaceae bacterium]